MVEISVLVWEVASFPSTSGGRLLGRRARLLGKTEVLLIPLISVVTSSLTASPGADVCTDLHHLSVS